MLNEDGTSFLFSGYTGIMTIQASATDPTTYLTLTPGNGGLTFGPDDGEMRLFLSDTTTAGLSWTHAYYTLRTTAPSTDVDLLLHGGVKVIS